MGDRVLFPRAMRTRRWKDSNRASSYLARGYPPIDDLQVPSRVPKSSRETSSRADNVIVLLRLQLRGNTLCLAIYCITLQRS